MEGCQPFLSLSAEKRKKGFHHGIGCVDFAVEQISGICGLLLNFYFGWNRKAPTNSDWLAIHYGYLLSLHNLQSAY